uniref:Uncharacterized protein n=1 Tax=Malurus cyaneus samueli TaxID=2593467 RepID=A0A8C5TW38_9PASS
MHLKILTGLSFSAGSSNTHLSFESMSSSERNPFKLISILTTASISEVSAGANIDWTINLCLLFSLGS